MTTDQQDPLTDEAPATAPAGECARCGGGGFIQVRQAYAERKHPGDLDALAFAVAEVDGRLAELERPAGDDAEALRRIREGRAYLTVSTEREVAYTAWADLDRKRRLAAQDVYPCPACREPLFLRWSSGCLDRDHHAASCERCLAILGKADAARHDRHAFPNEPAKR